jgi:hypothetical protein
MTGRTASPVWPKATDALKVETAMRMVSWYRGLRVACPEHLLTARKLSTIGRIYPPDSTDI